MITKFEILTLLMSGLGILVIPGMVALVRGAIKWTRVETKLDVLLDRMADLVKDQDKIHGAMLDQMKVDRDATDKRLRFIEEWWMRGRRNT